MLRSRIDAIIDETIAALRRHGHHLPPFARWTPEDWRAKREETAAMRAAFLGWAMAEFEPDAFEKSGILVFTSRMGDFRDLSSGRGRLYGEKVFMLGEGQYVPFHYHVVKTEDVVNRGGGILAIELLAVDEAGRPKNGPVSYARDGLAASGPTHTIVRLAPGESIVLPPYLAHAFWAEEGSTVCGEVSLANDETSDNLFLSPVPARLPIVEDVPARYVLTADYPAL